MQGVIIWTHTGVMARRVRSKEFLSYIAVAKPAQLKAVLHNASAEELMSICEVALNIIHGNLSIDIDIERRRGLLKTLASKQVNLSQKRRVLNLSPTYRNIVQKIIQAQQ